MCESVCVRVGGKEERGWNKSYAPLRTWRSRGGLRERERERERERAEAGRHLVSPFSLFLSPFSLSFDYSAFPRKKPPLWTEGRGSSDNLSLPRRRRREGEEEQEVGEFRFFCPRGNFRKVKGKTNINLQNQQNVEISLRPSAQNQHTKIRIRKCKPP